jgi:hypothetical protein
MTALWLGRIGEAESTTPAIVMARTLADTATQAAEARETAASGVTALTNHHPTQDAQAGPDGRNGGEGVDNRVCGGYRRG